MNRLQELQDACDEQTTEDCPHCHRESHKMLGGGFLCTNSDCPVNSFEHQKPWDRKITEFTRLSETVWKK